LLGTCVEALLGVLAEAKSGEGALECRHVSLQRPQLADAYTLMLLSHCLGLGKLFQLRAQVLG